MEPSTQASSAQPEPRQIDASAVPTASRLHAAFVFEYIYRRPDELAAKLGTTPAILLGKLERFLFGTWLPGGMFRHVTQPRYKVPTTVCCVVCGSLHPSTLAGFSPVQLGCFMCDQHPGRFSPARNFECAAQISWGYQAYAALTFEQQEAVQAAAQHYRKRLIRAAYTTLEELNNGHP